ncbi:MAG: hypothetical protein LUD72_00725, partial [Bacteroidales bacterium]|nr:hypothetical protein [Bacteroidales bacterium]
DKIEELLKKCLDSKDMAIGLMGLVGIADSFKQNKDKDGLPDIVKSDEDLHQEWCDDRREAERCVRIFIPIIEKWDNRLDETAKYCRSKMKEIEQDLFDSFKDRLQI